MIDFYLLGFYECSHDEKRFNLIAATKLHGGCGGRYVVIKIDITKTGLKIPTAF